MMIRWDVRMRAGRWVAGALVALTLAACQQNPAEPQADAQLQLDSLRLEMAPTGAVLFARGFVGGVAPVSADVHLAVQLSTDAHDEETVVARYAVCRAPDGSEYACHDLIFQMASGHSTTEVTAAVEALHMRFTHIFVAVPGGSVEVLNGTDAAAFDALQALPNVALVEYDRIGHVAVSSQREVRAALPVNRSAVVGGNGVLELQAGQTVTALYQQPDGSVLTTTLHM